MPNDRKNFAVSIEPETGKRLGRRTPLTANARKKSENQDHDEYTMGSKVLQKAPNVARRGLPIDKKKVEIETGRTEK